MTETHSPNQWPQPYRLLDAQPYWEALSDEKVTFQRCTDCAQPVWPAHSFCTHCGSKPLKWEPSSGRGEIYSHSTIMRGPTPVWTEIAPYTVGFIKMDEGYYLFAQIDAVPEAVQIGRRVEVKFVQRGEQKLPVFVLSDK